MCNDLLNDVFAWLLFRKGGNAARKSRRTRPVYRVFRKGRANKRRFFAHATRVFIGNLNACSLVRVCAHGWIRRCTVPVRPIFRLQILPATETIPSLYVVLESYFIPENDLFLQQLKHRNCTRIPIDF